MNSRDHSILAAIIKRKIDDALGMMAVDAKHRNFHIGELQAMRATAYTFARHANVDRAEFLTACGIDND